MLFETNEKNIYESWGFAMIGWNTVTVLIIGLLPLSAALIAVPLWIVLPLAYLIKNGAKQ